MWMTTLNFFKKISNLCKCFCVQALPQICEKRLLASSCLSVCPPVCLTIRPSAPIGWIFTKCNTLIFFENLLRKFEFN